MNEFTKTIDTEWNPSKVNRFKREDVPILKEIHNNPTARKIAKEEGVYMYSKWELLLNSLLIIAIIVGIVGLLYFVYDGKFQSNTDVDSVVNVPVNNTINNQYDYNPSTSNEYNNNYSIYVNNFVECP